MIQSTKAERLDTLKNTVFGRSKRGTGGSCGCGAQPNSCPPGPPGLPGQPGAPGEDGAQGEAAKSGNHGISMTGKANEPVS